MSELVLLVVEDEAGVRAGIVRDLEPLTSQVRIDEADDVADAQAAMAECAEAGDHVGLILADHRLPGRSGVDFLVALHAEPATRSIRKVLITGQAGHEDTIRAINQAGLAHYIAKPWDPDDLVAVAREQLTSFVIDSALDPLAYLQALDGPRLLEAYAQRSGAD